jgi:hypothetical protein
MPRRPCTRRRWPVLLAVLAITAGTALLAGGTSASAAAAHAARTTAAARASAAKQAPPTKAAWRKDIGHVRTPGRGCFSSSYPALTWHTVTCETAPKAPSAPARSASPAGNARPATVGGTASGDYVSTVPGLIAEATGTFWNVSSGITEKGQIANAGSTYANAFSLQLNSNDFSTPVCAGNSNSQCDAWEQFLYTYGTSASSIYIQYWLLNYNGSCPSNWMTYTPAAGSGTEPGCYMNSMATNVPALTASDLADIAFSGAAESGGTDEVSLAGDGTTAYAVGNDSVLDLSEGWDQTQWGVYGDESNSSGASEADFTSSGASLEAQTSIEVSSGPPSLTCNYGGFTAETNNLNLTSTPAIGSGDLPTMDSEQTSAATTNSNCSAASGGASQAGGLSTDGLTSTWAAQSDLDSTGSPQPLPTTTAGCGNWSGADGTQVVGLNNGEDLWSFGDTFLGPAVARQDFFNNSVIHNSMVVQDGSAFTTITGGTGCASGQPTSANAPITADGGGVIWPASSIVYGSDVEKFYYTVSSGLVQVDPQVAEIPQADLESGDTYSQQALSLDSCTANPIMWGAATIASGGDTYIYGSQQFSSTGGDTGGAGGELYLARSVGDPSDQGSWEYYTTSGWSSEGAPCGGLTLAPLGGSDPIEVPTEFSVTSVNGDFWLVDQDPTNGDQPGWAVAHEATTLTGFSNNPAASVDLFYPTQTTFSGIDDTPPGLTHYTVRMLEPSAVTPSQSGDVVVAYNVNDSDVDAGCIPLVDYDANVYRPRFVDVPISDLLTEASGAASVRQSATADGAASTTAGGGTAQPGTGTERAAAASVGPQVTILGKAQPKAATPAGSEQAAASTSWTYDPDAVPSPTAWSAASGGPTWSWSSSCPSSYAAVDPNINFNQLADGSIEVSWPNQGPDVWYWFHWQDDTSDPGTWNENEFWTEGPNADSYLIAPPAGALASSSATIFQSFPLPAETNPGDTFSFWVQAFAAGNGNVISPDSSATAVSVTPTSPTEGVSDLTATPGADSVTLNWTAPPAPVEGQSVWYSVRYKTPSSSTWTYTTDYVTNTADMAPLAGGQEYEFEVAVTDLETEVSATDANWSAPVEATPQS